MFNPFVVFVHHFKVPLIFEFITPNSWNFSFKTLCYIEKSELNFGIRVFCAWKYDFFSKNILKHN
jgi:hypothetical protein